MQRITDRAVLPKFRALRSLTFECTGKATPCAIGLTGLFPLQLALQQNPPKLEPLTSAGNIQAQSEGCGRGQPVIAAPEAGIGWVERRNHYHEDYKSQVS